MSKRSYDTLDDLLGPSSSSWIRNNRRRTVPKQARPDITAEFPMLPWTEQLVDSTALASDTPRRDELLGIRHDGEVTPPALYPREFEPVLTAYASKSQLYLPTHALNHVRAAVISTAAPLIRQSANAYNLGNTLSTTILPDPTKHKKLIGFFCDLLATNPITLLPAFGRPADHQFVNDETCRKCLFPNPLITKGSFTSLLQLQGVYVPTDRDLMRNVVTSRLVNTSYADTQLTNIRITNRSVRPQQLEKFELCKRLYAYILKNIGPQLAELTFDVLSSPMSNKRARDMITSYIEHAQFPELPDDEETTEPGFLTQAADN